MNGAIGGVLDGKRLVLTGVFPELGGGTGLSLGKDRTTAMIESFGGKVTSAVSGKTDFVLVGKDPGKFSSCFFFLFSSSSMRYHLTS